LGAAPSAAGGVDSPGGTEINAFNWKDKRVNVSEHPLMSVNINGTI